MHCRRRGSLELADTSPCDAALPRLSAECASGSALIRSTQDASGSSRGRKQSLIHQMSQRPAFVFTERVWWDGWEKKNYQKNKDGESSALVGEEAIKGDVSWHFLPIPRTLRPWKAGISLTVAHPAHLFIPVTICVTSAMTGFHKASRFNGATLGDLQEESRKLHGGETKTCQYLQKGRVTNLSDDDLSLRETLCGKATVADCHPAMNATLWN